MSDSVLDPEPARAAGGDAGAPAGDFRLPVWAWFSLWVVLVVGISALAHYAVRGVVNGWQLSIAFFLAINIVICWWEISLGMRSSDIERWNRDPEGLKERPPAGVLTARASLKDLTSTHLWVRVWSEYSYYDPSYTNRRSYGFWADVGNGWNTLLPSIFFLAGMTAGMVPPVVLGIVGTLIFYQKFYCTALYFAAYFFNRRYAGRPLGRIVAVVGGTNSVWLLFPAIGLYASIVLILQNRFDIFWT